MQYEYCRTCKKALNPEDKCDCNTKREKLSLVIDDGSRAITEEDLWAFIGAPLQDSKQ